MTIPVEREPIEFDLPYERCCFCGSPTPYWFVLKDVPVCRQCSQLYDTSEVPDKSEWIQHQQLR